MTDKLFFRIAGRSDDDPELNCEYPEPGEDKLMASQAKRATRS